MQGREQRFVVVSGGGTGIGRAITAAFAQDGARVAILGRRAEVLAATAADLNGMVASGSGAVSWHAADLAEPTEVACAADAITAESGGMVDVIINAAGGVDRSVAGDTLADVAASFTLDYRANVLTAVLLTRALVPLLRRPGGRIVSFSSIAAYSGRGGSYGAAKAALHAWIFSLAAELGSAGITANIVAPGYVADTEFFGGTMTPARRERLIGETVTGRAGSPADIAATVRFLAAPEAAQITGQIIGVNGGALFGR